MLSAKKQLPYRAPYEPGERRQARKLVLMLVAWAALVACRQAGSPKLEGRWRGQRAEGVPPGTESQANTFALGTEIVAKGDQIAISTPAGRNPQSTYFVDADEKNSVVIHTEKDGASSRETFTFTDDGRTMSWKVDEKRSIVFLKVDTK